MKNIKVGYKYIGTFPEENKLPTSTTPEKYFSVTPINTFCTFLSFHSEFNNNTLTYKIYI